MNRRTEQKMRKRQQCRELFPRCDRKLAELLIITNMRLARAARTTLDGIRKSILLNPPFPL